MSPEKVVIIGGGAAGLMAAEVLCETHEVHIYEKGKALGRKFLVAGKGGFNLTNAIYGEELYAKYQAPSFLQTALSGFDTKACRQWLAKLGIPTYTGTSGRIFPEKGMKPIQVLQKITDRLHQQNVQFHFQHEFVSFNENKQVVVQCRQQEITLSADYIVFALGGASWSVTGSDGTWTNAFNKTGIKTKPFQASNCGVNVAWPEEFKSAYAGSPLKNMQVSINDFSMKGEVLITEYGLEGNAIYPAVPEIREALKGKQTVYIQLDVKPQNTTDQLLDKLKGKNVQPKNYKYDFKLNALQLALLKLYTTKENYLSPELFCRQLKNIQIPITSLRPVEEAISTVGGIDTSEINPDFSLKADPKIYIVGEMLDWDAPTGGFLLQGCFATAYCAGKSIIAATKFTKL